jgi:hypothetical protein
MTAPNRPCNPVKSALLLLLCLIPLVALASDTTFDYGVKAGLNLAQHYAPNADETEYKVRTGMRTGAIAGAWLDLNVLPHLALGYELLYSMKGSRETIKVKQMDGEVFAKPAVMKVKYDLDYLEIPVLLKVKTLDIGNFSLVGITGTAFSLKINGHHELDGTVYLPEGDDFSEFHVAQESRLPYVNKFDYSMVYGTLLRWNGKVRLQAEFRFTLGWDYLQLPTFSLAEVEMEPVELRNQTYSVIIGMEF